MTQMPDTDIDFVAGAPVAGSLEVAWIHGVRSRRRDSEPAIQVHHYDEHTVILRQSKVTSFEAPFLFLIFGNDRALLLDTGAKKDPAKFPLRATIDQLLATWLAAHPRESYELVVAHTHGHGDHVAGDAQFEGRPGTTVIGREPAAVQQYFGFASWPEEIVTFDLGGRALEITGSPGHHRAAITVYDPRTGFLLTGDTVIPGRLYAFDYPQFLASLDRMVDFAESRPVTHVLGCHIEMTRTPGRDYPLGCTYQPDEPPLQLSVQQLTQIRDAARSVAGQQGRHVFDDFLIFNEPSLGDQLKLALHGLAARVTRRSGRAAG
jgi:hydroxyacylglutathione hydrolase